MMKREKIKKIEREEGERKRLCADVYVCVVYTLSTFNLICAATEQFFFTIQQET